MQSSPSVRRRFMLRGLSPLVLVILAIEFLDEFVDGTKEAALPLIRTDLNLSYDDIGLLLTLPALLANILIEPILGILADVWRRRVLILGGGVVFALSLLLTAASQNYSVLLLSFILFYPASGAYVSLSQATLMDADPTRHEQNMVRWTVAGTVGVLFGLLMVGSLAALTGWRVFYGVSALLTALTWVVLWRMRFPNPSPTQSDEDEYAQASSQRDFRAGLRDALGALRRREVLRWLTLLEFSEFMTGIFIGYLSLYFVDVVGVEESQAGIAVAIYMASGLVGELILLPLLERVSGVRYLRASAAVLLVVYSAFWLSTGLPIKLVLGGLVGLVSAGWYSILKGNLYTAMPGQSGSVLLVGNLFGIIGSLLPLFIGLAADQFGLQNAMLFPLIGCVALLLGLPRRS